MHWFGPSLSLLVLVSLGGVNASSQEQAADLKYAEDILRQAHINLETEALVKFFEERTLSPQEQNKLAALVEELGDLSYGKRVQAHHKLLRAGQLATPLLTQALKAKDQEIVRRAELCLQFISQNTEAPQVIAAGKVLAHRNSPQAAKLLIDYLPFAFDRDVVDQLTHSVAKTALREGKPHPAIIKALKDPQAVRRSAAGVALAASPNYRDQVLPLLEDPVLEVRLQVALALVHAQEARGVATLIQLLDRVAEEKRWQAEDILRRLAGEKAPKETLAGVIPAAKVRQAWEQWAKNLPEKELNLRLAKLKEQPPYLNYTLITQMGTKGLNGQVMELGPNKKERWKIDGLRYPVDAQIIGNNRVLIAEYLNRRITERDFTGKELWSMQVDLPIACQRLANGNTFIASRRQLLEVNRAGKEIFSHNSPTSISAARKMPNGQMVMVNTGGILLHLDGQGKQINTFKVGQVYTLGGNIDILPNGRILVPQYRDHKVVEYSLAGKVLWQANIPMPTSAMRLSNGNTLVVSMTQQRVVEINRNGKIVWEHRTEGRPWRARRR